MYKLLSILSVLIIISTVPIVSSEVIRGESTASFVDSFDIESQETEVRGIWFDSSGKTMFILGHEDGEVNIYKLTIAWDVSTASFVS